MTHEGKWWEKWWNIIESKWKQWQHVEDMMKQMMKCDLKKREIKTRTEWWKLVRNMMTFDENQFRNSDNMI